MVLLNGKKEWVEDRQVQLQENFFQREPDFFRPRRGGPTFTGSLSNTLPRMQDVYALSNGAPSPRAIRLSAS